MADQDSNVPPRPSEAAKVQPKKETVRISLPPKPTASPTIKLPALPPSGAGTGAPAPAARPAPAAAPASSGAPKPAPKPAAAAAPANRVATTPGKAAPSPARRAPAPARSAAGPTVLDNVLAIVAMVVALAAIGNMFYLLTLITDNPM